MQVTIAQAECIRKHINSLIEDIKEIEEGKGIFTESYRFEDLIQARISLVSLIQQLGKFTVNIR